MKFLGRFPLWITACTLTIIPNVRADIASAVDSPLTWQTGGNTAWYDQSVVSASGGDAAQSGAIDHGEQTYVQTTVFGPGTISFQWRIDSQSDAATGNYDMLRFSMDSDGAYATVFGSAGWTTVTQRVTAGSHSLRWTYEKDAVGSTGSDAAWLDAVVWTPDPDSTPPAPATGLTAQPRNGAVSLRWTNPGDIDFSGVRVVRKQGGSPTNEMDGTIVYDGSGTLAIDSGLVNGTRYYYAAYSYDMNSNYAPPATTDTVPNGARGDFDGDGIEDICLIDINGIPGSVAPYSWFVLGSDGGIIVQAFGYAGTVPVKGDFDGDGIEDFGVYEPNGIPGVIDPGSWFLSKSSLRTGTTLYVDIIPLGASGGTPVVGDFDGDGTTDVGIYDGGGVNAGLTAGSWVVSHSSLSSASAFHTETLHLGVDAGSPVVGDFDGDGITDLGLYDETGQSGAPAGTWHLSMSGSSSASNLQVTTMNLGVTGPKLLVADFDGDHIDDPGFYDQASGTWSLSMSASSSASNVHVETSHFGYPGTAPHVGDFDGDGVADTGLYDASGIPGYVLDGSWYLAKSSDGFETFRFGYAGTENVCMQIFDSGFLWDAEVSRVGTGVLAVNLSYEQDWVVEADLVGCNAPGGFLRYLFNEGSFQFDLFTGAGQLYLRLANGYIDFMSSTVGGVSNPGGGSDHLAITSGADNIRSGDHTVRVEYLRSLGRCRMWWDNERVGDWEIRVRNIPRPMTSWSVQHMSACTLRYYQGTFTSRLDQ